MKYFKCQESERTSVGKRNRRKNAARKERRIERDSKRRQRENRRVLHVVVRLYLLLRFQPKMICFFPRLRHAKNDLELCALTQG